MRDKISRLRIAGVIVFGLVCGNAFARRATRSVELQRVTQSANLFAEDVYQALIKPEPDTGKPKLNITYENKNVVFSPLSLDVAFAMLMAGTTGNTEKEIRGALRIKEDTKESDMHKGFQELINSFKDKGNDEDEVQLHLANRIYVGPLYPIRPSFLYAVRQHFFADAEQLNFGESEKASNTVNEWVRKATKDRIKDIVTPSMLNNQTLMVLVNAMHFKGEWKFQFNPDYTNESRFTTISGSEIPMNMMRMERPRRMPYAKIAELRLAAVSMPYTTTRYSLVILLPEKGQSLKDIESRIHDGLLSSIPTRLRPTIVDIRLPKFKMESNIDLISSKVVETLGMASITTQFAEFDKMTDEKGPHITNIVHKAFLEINEAGTEAAASTALVAQARSLIVDPEPAIKFDVDRPFIAYIYDSKTNSVLFITRKIM